MIHIEQNQKIPENENLRVYSISGDYSDNDLILCYELSDPQTPISSLQAQFIAYGSIVYQFNEPEKLGEAIISVDPNSTHDAAILYKEEEARKAKKMELIS